MIEDTKLDNVISIALWSIRRLPTLRYRLTALKELRGVVGDEHMYAKFIDECIREVESLNK